LRYRTLGRFTFARSGRPPWRPDIGIATLICRCMFRLLVEPLATGGQRYRQSLTARNQQLRHAGTFVLMKEVACAVFCLWLLGPLPWCRAEEQESALFQESAIRFGSAPPAVDELDQAFLVRWVRRVMVQQLRAGTRTESPFTPMSLARLACPVAVTLRDQGQVVGHGDSPCQAVVEACQQAARSALADAKARRALSEDDLAGLHLELELIGPRERVGFAREAREQLIARFEPAVHGMAARFGRQEVMVCPSELISLEDDTDPPVDAGRSFARYTRAMEDLLTQLARVAPDSRNEPEKVVLLRFRTLHLYEPRPGDKPVALLAGMRVIRLEDVTRESLLAATEQFARFIRYRQNQDGFFAYEYLPGHGLYRPKGQNWIRQAATMWALAKHASQRNDRASAKALVGALAAFGKMAKPLPEQPNASFIATPDGDHALGTTALVCLALMDAPDRDRHVDFRLALLNGLAAMQLDSGRFMTHFPPSPSKSSQDYYPGEALLAIARHYVLSTDPKWRAICDKSLPYYVSYFRANHPAPFVPWQTQAWGQLARATLLAKYADFVFEMSDFLAASQIAAVDPTMPIYDGGFDVHGTGRAGVSSAVYLEGFVDAVRTAEAMGDHERAQRYRTIARKAARFVLQLQFRREECYYVKSPDDVIGGVRNTPGDPSLRIDHTQHGLMSLLGAESLITPVTKPAENGQ